MALPISFTSSDPIRQALRQASAETGVGFDYLLKTATRESGLDPQAQASTSSASGLFQFVEQTWLATVKEEGPAHGLGELATHIERGGDGRYQVADAEAREAILNLRSDPKVSAVMAGALTQRNGAELTQSLGRQPSPGELYIAHFLGSGDGARLIKLAEQTPKAAAAEIFPRAAAANRAIFFAGDGTARPAHDVYDALIARHGATQTGLVAQMRRIEDKVTTFFSSLFRFSEAEGGGEAGAATPLAPAFQAAVEDRLAASAPPTLQAASLGNPQDGGFRPTDTVTGRATVRPGQTLKPQQASLSGVAEADEARKSDLTGTMRESGQASEPVFTTPSRAASRLFAQDSYDTQVEWFASGRGHADPAKVA